MLYYRKITNQYVQSLLLIPSLNDTKSPYDFFIIDKKLDKIESSIDFVYSRQLRFIGGKFSIDISNKFSA